MTEYATIHELFEAWRSELSDRHFYSGDPDPGGTRMLDRCVAELNHVMQVDPVIATARTPRTPIAGEDLPDEELDAHERLVDEIYQAVTHRLRIDRMRQGLPPEPPSITCPFCGLTSYNHNDIRENYCGDCHRHFGDFQADDDVGARQHHQEYLGRRQSLRQAARDLGIRTPRPDRINERLQQPIHDELQCHWLKGPAGWECEHGVFTTEHPRGYCDQGCCR